MDKKIKHIIFITEGGLGKVIASTAVVKRLKETFPDKKIIVVSGSPEIFQYNPNVYKTFRFDNPLYFYDDYVNEESFIIKAEPYVDSDYVHGKAHLLEAWCRQSGVEWKSAKPELFFMENELSAAQLYVNKITGGGKKKFVLFQWAGGLVPNDKEPMNFHDAQMKMHRRSLPQKVAQQIVNKLIRTNSIVGTVQHENIPQLEGAEKVFFPIRGVLALLKYCEGFIGIDSFLHHAAMSFGTKGVVVWGGTSPKRLGYSEQVNMHKAACPIPACHRPDTFLFDGNPSTGLWNCPHNEACLRWDAEEIVQAYIKLVDVQEEKCQTGKKK